MIIREMRFDQLEKFAKCLVNNGNGTFTLTTTPGSASGANFKSVKASDTMRAFDRTITANAVRTING